ncbi:hypothetical protein [Thermomonospora echinospora]|uniref:hypothetical protein n=1 Tax=Thermomonospora echinospora TaxID=1992 RepID=UPI0011B00727|nr:hypothetical protein [Thermomonospora echinospora]
MGEGAAKPPMVLAVAVVPGTIVRAFLMVPRPAVAEGQEAEAGEAPQDGEREMAGVEDAVGADGGGAAEKSGEAKKGSAGAGRPDEGLDEAVAELPEGLAKLVGFARAERYPFEPPPGTFAARLLAFQREHPKLYASRHVVLATGKVVLGLLGVAVFFQLILSRVIQWIIERLPNMDLPGLPLPDLDLPSIPWPHIPLPDLPDLPDVTLPGWLKAVLATAKYWIPILIAIGAAVQEVRKRKRRSAAAQSAAEPDGPPADRADATEPEPAGRATRPTGAAVRQGGEPAWRDGEPAQRAGEAVRRDGEVTRRAGETASARARPGTGEDGADTRRTGGDRQPDAHR